MRLVCICSVVIACITTDTRNSAHCLAIPGLEMPAPNKMKETLVPLSPTSSRSNSNASTSPDTQTSTPTSPTASPNDDTQFATAPTTTSPWQYREWQQPLLTAINALHAVINVAASTHLPRTSNTGTTSKSIPASRPLQELTRATTFPDHRQPVLALQQPQVASKKHT